MVGVIIDMKRGKITFKVNNESMVFDVFKMMKTTPMEVARRIDSLNAIDECVNEKIYECLK